MRYDPGSVEGRFLSGDPAAVAEAVRWIARVVASSSFWSLRADWKDLHQEALGRVVESLREGRFDPAADFRTYVQGVARFTALKALGRLSRTPRPGHPRGDDADVESEVAFEERTEDAVVAQQLARHVLDEASEECRHLFREFFLEDRSYGEIAEAEGLPIGTVKSRVFRCLEAAHRLVAGRGGRVRRPFFGNPPSRSGE